MIFNEQLLVGIITLKLSLSTKNEQYLLKIHYCEVKKIMSTQFRCDK
jgi:hypothetical protein